MENSVGVFGLLSELAGKPCESTLARDGTVERTGVGGGQPAGLIETLADKEGRVEARLGFE